MSFTDKCGGGGGTVREGKRLGATAGRQKRGQIDHVIYITLHLALALPHGKHNIK